MSRVKTKYYLYIIFLLIIFISYNYANAQKSYSSKVNNLKSLLNEGISSDSAASIYSLIGAAYYQGDIMYKAIIYKKKAAEIYKKKNNLEKYSEHLETIGILYSFINDYKQSLNYFLDAIKILDKQNKKNIHYYSLIQNIGITYQEAGEYKKSLSYLLNSLKFFERDTSSNKEYLVVNYTDLGVIYNSVNLVDSSFYYYHKALAVAKKYSINKYIGGILVNLGDIYGKLKIYDKAKTNYIDALKNFKENHDNRGYWHTVYGFAVVEKDLNNAKQSEDSLLKAIKYFKLINDLGYLKDSYKTLSEIYEERNDISKAFSYFKLYSIVNDTIAASDQKNKMTKLQMQYELQKTEIESTNELKLLQKEDKLKMYQISILIILLLIIMLIIVLYVLRLQSHKKITEIRLENTRLVQQKMGIKLEYKQKELENLALYIMQKNEFLEQIKSDMGSLKKTVENEQQTKIKTISLKITQSLRKNKDLVQLQERIDQVHAGFLNKLTVKYPDLTEKEKRLCALLKLNFSSKEISSLNNISENAVMMARYRMRKKMNVANDENLVEFLQKLG